MFYISEIFFLIDIFLFLLPGPRYYYLPKITGLTSSLFNLFIVSIASGIQKKFYFNLKLEEKSECNNNKYNYKYPLNYIDLFTNTIIKYNFYYILLFHFI